MRVQTRPSNDNAMTHAPKMTEVPAWEISRRDAADARGLAGAMLAAHFGGAVPPSHPGTRTDPGTGCPLAISPWLSWSRTRGAVLAALYGSGPVGCDVERVRAVDALSMVGTIGSQAERDWLSQQAEPARTRAFFRLWTVKEAVLKAAGTGFRHDARRLSVPEALLAARQPEVVIACAGQSWHIRIRAEGPFQMALAWQMRT